MPFSARRASGTSRPTRSPRLGASLTGARGDIDVLGADEVEQLAAHAADEQDAALYRVAAFPGLRMGELRALRWRDVDWTARLIHVRRNRPANGGEELPKSGKSVRCR